VRGRRAHSVSSSPSHRTDTSLPVRLTGLGAGAGQTSHESDKTLTTFRELGVLPGICDALERAGITTPFAIQEMTLSVALLGTDLIGQARTGTGKTLAFGIPVLQRSVAPSDPAYADLPQGKPQALIVAPTRELALQVSGDLALASKDLGLRVLTVYGGVGYDTQLDTLASGVDIVVGTPGRLIDLANRRALDLSHVHALVLDEADEMLDLGFLPDVERLLAMTPETRQTMLFSATMPSAIVGLARHHMRHPMNIRAESSYDTTMVPATAQFIYLAHDLDKPEIIGLLLQAEDAGKMIVFTRTKRQAQRVADDLAERGFRASALHGDMAQVAREKALNRFREDKLDVLVATDVAARGIDVALVTHVVNYTCPEDDKAYVHRIGRTGRAGASGIAITFVDWADIHRWKMINKTLELPFDEPLETYSTSEHLFHDQGIAPGTKGRIVDPAPQPPREPRGDRGGSDRGGRGGGRGERSDRGGDRGRSGDRPTRDRNRTRTRVGDTAPAGDAAPAAASTGSTEGSAPSEGASRNRRRRRSRSGSGSGSGEGQPTTTA
jgi:superfamily II DNA/RNA helicase